ncbi:hypothetical protein chiPu_0017932 [Chiloscyllium punctatum]|uniref:Beta-crystallin A2 n=1 Tax=Chiloscyllium punctatum TaxID=137246 RepID=A0A401RJU2_CHIPU|nr:hypothetical protein [Chiloscyllium punctatum]
MRMGMGMCGRRLGIEGQIGGNAVGWRDSAHSAPKLAKRQQYKSGAASLTRTTAASLFDLPTANTSKCSAHPSLATQGTGRYFKMTTQPMDIMGQWKITVWEEQNFQGKHCEFMLECPNIMERGFNKIRSIKVECGPWVGYEYPEFQGQQFILEKGDYPHWDAWSGNSGYRTEHMLSFRPIKCAVSPS